MQDSNYLSKLNGNVAGHNPFYRPREGSIPFNDIRKVVLKLIPRLSDKQDPFWTDAAQNVLTAHLIHCYKQGISFKDSLYSFLDTTTWELGNSIMQHGGMMQDEDARPYLIGYTGLRREALAAIVAEIAINVRSFLQTDPIILFFLERRGQQDT